jgi:predicted peptidase
MRSRYVLASLLVGFVVGCGATSNSPADRSASDANKTGFLDKTYTDPNGKAWPYVVFVPHDYDGKKGFPVILFLHGLGDAWRIGSGGDTKRVGSGLGPFIEKDEKSFGFITIFPQAEPNVGWDPRGPNGKRALAELDEVMKEYKTDPKRVYCTGLSMGGFGTWAMAAASPERWAAIVPVCGGGKTEWAERIKAIPTWAFHGTDDRTVPVMQSREMVAALKKAGASPRYTEYPGVDHNCWDRAYSDPALYPWLAQQKKK